MGLKQTIGVITVAAILIKAAYDTGVEDGEKKNNRGCSYNPHARKDDNRINYHNLGNAGKEAVKKTKTKFEDKIIDKVADKIIDGKQINITVTFSDK